MTTKNKKHPADRMTAKELSTRDALQRINHEAQLVNGLQQALESAKDSTGTFAEYNFKHLSENQLDDIENKIAELNELLFWAMCTLHNGAAKHIRGMQA